MITCSLSTTSTHRSSNKPENVVRTCHHSYHGVVYFFVWRPSEFRCYSNCHTLTARSNNSWCGPLTTVVFGAHCLYFTVLTLNLSTRDSKSTQCGRRCPYLSTIVVVGGRCLRGRELHTVRASWSTLVNVRRCGRSVHPGDENCTQCGRRGPYLSTIVVVGGRCIRGVKTAYSAGVVVHTCQRSSLWAIGASEG